MAVPTWKLRYGCDGCLLADAVDDHHMQLNEGTEVVLARDYSSLREAHDRLKQKFEIACQLGGNLMVGETLKDGIDAVLKNSANAQRR